MTVDSLQELEENFELFDSWEDKYSYLIDLGKRLPAFEDDLKIAEREVKGCVSKVWMESWISTGENGEDVFHFKADSDAMIVKGLIAILMVAFNDRPVSEIASVDINQTFEQLGLSAHLSPNRRNGFFSMVKYIQAYAGGQTPAAQA